MSLFQSPEWEKFKLATGYQKSYRVDGVLILQKNLPFGRCMLYSPMITNSEKLITNNYNEKLKTLGKENRAIFYRAELNIPKTTQYPIPNTQYQKSFEEMQPENTLILDISKSESNILAQMKQKGRYNIKIAKKHGVIVKKTRQIDNFYHLYQETAKRQKITFRARQYFQTLLDILEPKGYAEVFEAILNNHQSPITNHQSNPNNQIPNTQYEIPDTKSINVLASAIISFYKNRATYLFGASSSENRELMAPYALHWQIILEAKRRGFTEYDLFGIAPNDDPKHRWAGITRFKRQFGGREVNLLGSYDTIFRPAEYWVFKIAEIIRRG